MSTSKKRRFQTPAVASCADQLKHDPDLTPEFQAELDRRHADMLAHPDDEVTWEQVSRKMLNRKRQKGATHGNI
jgi:putative addiction module component (TIGR02574 family)